MKPAIKNSLLVWSVIVLILINVSALGTMWYHKSSRTKRIGTMHSQNQSPRERRGNGIQEKLSLSPKQKAAFDSLYKLHRSNSSAMMTEMQKNRDALQSLITLDEANMDSVRSLNRQNALIYEDISWAQLEMHRSRMQLLNEDQKKMYKELQGTFGDRNRARNGSARGNGPGF